MSTQNPLPGIRPADARFSSGPTRKRPGWSLSALEGALVGRSHRSKPARARLKEAIDRSRNLLGVPADFRVAIVPASDTGAMEFVGTISGSMGTVIHSAGPGGTLRVRGWMNNTGNLLDLDSPITLVPAAFGQAPTKIVGGTVRGAGAQLITAGNGTITLDGVALETDVSIGPNIDLTLTGN